MRRQVLNTLNAYSSDEDFLSSPEELIEEARKGRMFILVDDEDRENEGDLVIPAQFCTPETINFMARHGRGLICLALTRERCEQLDLPLMAQGNTSRLTTAFTLSIEAREGVTTGISAADRAHTVAVAIEPASTRTDIRTPGHIFPLMARDGGVLVRAGHTEAAVDIPRLAGLTPAGVICEIMNDDGSMARLPDLVPFAQLHGLKIGAIADLIQHRLRNDRLVKATQRKQIESRFGGEFQLIVYQSLIDGIEQMALVKGDITTPEPVLTRVHSPNVIRDVLGGGGHGDQVQLAMQEIERAGRGVIVILRQWHQSVTESLMEVEPKQERKPQDLRVYGIGAQILRDLGVRDMILLSNSAFEPIGLDGFGLRVVETRPLG